MAKELPDKPNLRPEEVREYLGISKHHIYALLADGVIPNFKLGGKTIRIPRDGLIRWLKENARTSD